MALIGFSIFEMKLYNATTLSKCANFDFVEIRRDSTELKQA